MFLFTLKGDEKSSAAPGAAVTSVDADVAQSQSRQRKRIDADEAKYAARLSSALGKDPLVPPTVTSDQLAEPSPMPCSADLGYGKKNLITCP